MTRYIKNTVILAKVEGTYGTDALPTGAANAILVSNPSHELMAAGIDRPILTGVLGQQPKLIGSRFVKIGFDAEISSSGTLGTAPAWGPLLRGCAMAEVITAASRVEYTPVSSSMESLTIYYYDDGVLKKALGCMGTVELDMTAGSRPVFKFSFTGLDGGLATAPNPAQTLAAWKPPVSVIAGNTLAVKLGCAYAAAALTGGTAYLGRGLTLNLSNSVQQNELLGGNSVSISDRAPTGSLQLDLSADDEGSFYTDITTAALTSLGLVHGTVAGGKVLVYTPAVQRLDPKQADYNGQRHTSMSLHLTPLSGNDELRIVAC